MIELVLKMINTLRLPSDIYDRVVLKRINALRVPSNIYDRACA